MVTLSVLLSVYDSETSSSLNESLKSIWSDQIHRPDEIILVEDGPLKSSLQHVIKEWKDTLGEKLRIVINEQNLGLTKSLNKGLRVATGDYIARMDSDDISAPE
ncbi:MAG: glycosyltransferase, partial [Allobaculum sp.]|nr:glycosyltransferase [Allobaculum sp.]